MFTPSPNPGFNPEIGGGVPLTPQEQPCFYATPAPEVDWETRMDIEERMDALVPHVVCSATAKWLVKVALQDRREANRLLHRLTRPEGFNGVNAKVAEG